MTIQDGFSEAMRQVEALHAEIATLKNDLDAASRWYQEQMKEHKAENAALRSWGEEILARNTVEQNRRVELEASNLGLRRLCGRALSFTVVDNLTGQALERELKKAAKGGTS